MWHKKPSASWKAGWREIGGQRIYARSRWEANYARYLEWLRANGSIAKWEHEPETFWFEGIKRGTCALNIEINPDNAQGSNPNWRGKVVIDSILIK